MRNSNPPAAMLGLGLIAVAVMASMFRKKDDVAQYVVGTAPSTANPSIVYRVLATPAAKGMVA